MPIIRVFFFLFFSILTVTSFSQTKEIAITIDDLPFVGTTANKPGNLQRESERFLKIMQTLVDNKVPAVGFVIAGSIEHGQWELLEQFHKAGFVIGNHTYSHGYINRMGAQKYIDDIARADNVLTPLYDGPKYFRFPYLAEGRQGIKQEVSDYLVQNQYIVAPVTIDSKDFQFNEQFLRINWRSREQNLASIKKRYLAYIWNQTLKAEKNRHDQPIKQVLLIHANLLNAYCLQDIIQMYKDNGYEFVTLSEALTAPVLTSTIPSVSFSAIPLQSTSTAQQ